MKKINKSKLYELIGKATVRATVWAMSVYLVYQASLYILDNCITVYRQNISKRNQLKGGRYMFFAIAGFLSGALLVLLFNENAERANELLKDTINNLEEDIDLLNSKIKNRDRMIEKQQKDNAILLDNAAELRAKMEDLRNNIELLTNNLTDENKELIPDYQSENQFNKTHKYMNFYCYYSIFNSRNQEV